MENEATSDSLKVLSPVEIASTGSPSSVVATERLDLARKPYRIDVFMR